MKILKGLIITMRPQQWLKNLAILLPITYSGDLFNTRLALPVLLGFITFCGLSSTIYLINDVMDRENDRLHPKKKFRPLAHGDISSTHALVTALFVGLVSLTSAYLISGYFFVLAAIYLSLLILYSLALKNVVLIDALIVAFGFVVRLWAGAIIPAVPISSWLIITTAAIAILISFGRRRAEYYTLEDKAKDHRKVLGEYPPQFLDVAITSSTSIGLLAYFLYTFFAPLQEARQSFWQGYLPLHWESPRWLMITIPLAIFAVYRYLFVIYAHQGGEDPEKDVLNDKMLLASIAGWFAMTVLSIYVF